jgi:calcineurin-like phosphoesterase family protein
MIHFTADLHLGHANIIKYCNRPFSNVEEMDEELIRRWNSVVEPGDKVYHLGDFCFVREVEKANYYLSRLNGHKFFLKGNHDKGRHRPTRGFSDLGHYYELKVEDKEMERKQLIVLCHYAFLVWNKSHHGSWHLFGHSHGTLPRWVEDDSRACMDVGVDSHDYYPVSYDNVKLIMAGKKFKPTDHHGNR